MNQNQITDISFLSGMKNLKKLSLWGNNITDVSSLMELTNLVELELSHNDIPEEQKEMLEDALPSTQILW